MLSGKETVFSIKKEENRSLLEDLFSIDAVSNTLKVHQQTILNWEKKKFVFPPLIWKRRIYTAQHIRLCEKIKPLLDRRISLKIIKSMLDSDGKFK